MNPSFLKPFMKKLTRERVVPSSDEKYLYVWRAHPPKNTGAAE
jgi:hypothetical protein